MNRVRSPNGWRDTLALERNVVAASGAVFLLGFGEELWKKFLPKYLETLGAGAVAIGFFGTTEAFCDAVYQYPGGWLADRVGRRRAFALFLVVAAVGYAVYLLAPSWPWLFLGLALTMAWSSMGSPATFAVIGDALPRERRAMGFTLQSILRRIPMVISPLVGGALIAALGITSGLRVGFAVTLALAAATGLLVLTMNLAVAVPHPSTLAGVWRSLPRPLKRLLVSDIVIRTCEGMAGVFIVLYVTGVTGVALRTYGVLVAVQMATSILVYVPAARIADRLGRKPFVTATFLAFALFPLAVAVAGSMPALVAAFVIGGLREIGEPSRKAMIVDLADSRMRARTVGLYYLIRGLAVTPAATIGGLLWGIAPVMALVSAGVVGFVGTIVFVATVEERYVEGQWSNQEEVG